MPLNPKQKLFVKHYLAEKNATQAAIKAGYSKKTAHAIGAENLTKPLIAQAIEKGLAKQAQSADITAERVIKRISEFAFDKTNIKANDTLKACELLGKHFELFTDNLTLAGKGGGSINVNLTMPTNDSEVKNLGDIKPEKPDGKDG